MKTEKNNRLRGTVLFTVVAVMALLIIFLTGTLALATASNNRAHKSYSSSQASYTAKTAITGFTQALEASEEVRNKIVNLGIDGNSNIIHPTITFNEGGSQDRAMGIIGYWDEHGVWHDNQITVERENLANPTDPNNPAKTEWVYDWKETQKWVQIEKVKITATARVGREESTVTAYLTKMPGDPGETETVPTNPRTNTGGIKGLNTVGDGVFKNGGRYTGGMGIGLSGDGETNLKKHTYELRNSCELSTTLSFINGDVYMGEGTFSINVNYNAADVPVSQTVINGSLALKNDTLVTLENEIKYNFTQKQIPYLYVNDAMFFKNQAYISVYKGENAKFEHTSNPAQPYNIFAGTINARNNNYILHGDLYLMDEYKPGEKYTVSVEGQSYDVIKGDNYFGGDNQNNSQLYKWTYDTVNKTESQNKSEGGNIWCNGNLNLLGGGEYDGSIYVEGDCVIRNNTYIHGDLVVGGKLDGPGDNKLKVDGHVYCDKSKMTGYSPDSNNNNSNQPPTYKKVENKYHGPDAYKPKEGEEPNWSDLKIIDSAKREWFRWNPWDHQKQNEADQWKPTDINGDFAEENPQVRYCKYNENYCKGIIMCKKGGDYTYFYPEEEYVAADYDTVKSVDEVISDFLSNKTSLDDVDTKTIIEKWVNITDVEKSWEGSREPYNCKLIRVTNSAGEQSFRETSIPCNNAQFLLDPVTGEIMEDAEVPHYTKADFDGNDTNQDVGAQRFTWYNEQNRQEVSESIATAPPPEPGEQIESKDKIQPLGDREIYPAKMKREAIYGSYAGGSYEGAFTMAPDETKIIKTLQEVRQDLGFKKTGVDYPRTLKDAAGEAVAAALENANGSPKDTAIALNGNVKANTTNTSIWGHPTDKDIITGNCVITGSISGSEMSGNDGKYKAKSRDYERAVYQNGTKGDNTTYHSKVIEINPLGKEIWVVLDDVSLSNEAEIHVDFTNPTNGKQEGKVKFFIKGDVNLDKGAIINKKIASGSDDSNPLDINMVTHTNTDFAMEFYGEDDSQLLLTNECTLSGTFKSPYTNFRSSVVGKYRVNYTDEYGVDWTTKKRGSQLPGEDMVQGCPCIIGNALFKDVLETQNDFGLYYTESGQTGDQGNTDDQGNQDVTTRVIRAATGEKWFFEFYSAT